MAEKIETKRVLANEFVVLKKLDTLNLRARLSNQEDQNAYDEMVADLKKAKEEYDEMNKALAEKTLDLASANVKLAAEKMEAEKQRIAFEEEYKRYQESKDELDRLCAQIKTSYSTEDISSFLNETIKKFNEEHSSDSNVAQYVINSLDVDLKVRIYDDSQIKIDENGKIIVNEDAPNDKKSLKFIAPGLNETTEDSLSSIKITIQAVPK